MVHAPLTESRHSVKSRIEQALILVLAGCLWLAERVYSPLYQLLEQESIDHETLCTLIDFEGGGSCF